MGEPTLLYGIGATKAGTSWLYDYLSTHPECQFRSMKELHFFDVLEDLNGQWAAWRSKELQRKQTRLERRLSHAKPAQKAKISESLADLKEWNHAFEVAPGDSELYLDFLLKDCDAKTKVIGDITPSYATLGRDSFQYMAKLAPKTRFIYLLRDPLDRLWSNIRMAANRTADKADFGARAAELTEKFLRGDHAALSARTDYRGTLTRLLDVMPRAQIFVTFFETLFTNETVKKLTEFLNIAPHAADFGRYSNRGKPLAMDLSQQHAVLEKLRPQYDYICDFFDGQIPALWQNRIDQLQAVKV